MGHSWKPGWWRSLGLAPKPKLASEPEVNCTTHTCQQCSCCSYQSVQMGNPLPAAGHCPPSPWHSPVSQSFPILVSILVINWHSLTCLIQEISREKSLGPLVAMKQCIYKNKTGILCISWKNSLCRENNPLWTHYTIYPPLHGFPWPCIIGTSKRNPHTGEKNRPIGL